jgi:hypothetical protein
MTRTLRQINRAGLVIVTLTLAEALAGCSSGTPFDDPGYDYTQRMLTISPSAGNAQAANVVIQTAGPWPSRGHDTNVPANGVRMDKAIQRFETRGAQPTSPIPAAASANVGGSGVPPQ